MATTELTKTLATNLGDAAKRTNHLIDELDQSLVAMGGPIVEVDGLTLRQSLRSVLDSILAARALL